MIAEVIAAMRDRQDLHCALFCLALVPLPAAAALLRILIGG